MKFLVNGWSEKGKFMSQCRIDKHGLGINKTKEKERGKVCIHTKAMAMEKACWGVMSQQKCYIWCSSFAKKILPTSKATCAGAQSDDETAARRLESHAVLSCPEGRRKQRLHTRAPEVAISVVITPSFTVWIWSKWTLPICKESAEAIVYFACFRVLDPSHKN